MCCILFVFYYVRSSVQLKIHTANIEASKFVCFLSVMKDFPNASSMHMLLLQYSYISLFCFRKWSSQKYNCAPEGWQDLMMVLGGAVMKRGRP